MMEMVIEGRPRFSWAIWVMFALALFIILSSAITDHWIFALTLIPPVFCIFLLMLARPRPVRLDAMKTGLMLEHPCMTIPWEDITTVRRHWQHQNPRKNVSGGCHIELHHTQGALLIPSPSVPPSEQLFHDFFARCSPGGTRYVAPVLQDHLEKWRTTFGDDKVFSFGARIKMYCALMPPGVAVFLGLILGVIVMWIVVAMIPERKHMKDELVGNASMTAVYVLMGLFALLSGLTRLNRGGHRKIKKWKEASLVISPAGLAMSQGNSEGEMKWSEVIDIQFQKKENDGIMIKVAGAQFQIFDLYDRPLYLIYQHLMRYWANKEV